MLDGRYRLDLQLGGDLLGVSYRATRIADEHQVRARAYRVRSDARARVEERLAALRELDHPALPRRLDELTLEREQLVTQWLIDEHRVGSSLADAIAAAPDHRVDLQRVISTVRELAELFDDLARQPTPIVHGGLTPHSILIAAGERGASLLDLGLSSELVRASSTRGFADSLGYSAPEQLYAEATAAADIWALAAIAVVALTGARLSSMRDSSSSTLRWRERVELPATLARTLDQMLEPDPLQRIPAGDVARALAELERPAGGGGAHQGQHHPWTSSKTSHKRVTHPPRPVMPRPAPARARPGADPEVPTMRPDELSRELSQAHQVAVTLEQQQRNSLVLARVLVVLVTAIVAALTTYIAIALT